MRLVHKIHKNIYLNMHDYNNKNIVIRLLKISTTLRK